MQTVKASIRVKSACELKKRPYLLLEVVIALAILSLCLLPLLKPHFELYIAEQHFLSEMEMERWAHEWMVEELARLYQNDIPWAEIRDGVEMEIRDVRLRKLGFRAYRRFKGILAKGEELAGFDSKPLQYVELQLIVKRGKRIFEFRPRFFIELQS